MLLAVKSDRDRARAILCHLMNRAINCSLFLDASRAGDNAGTTGCRAALHHGCENALLDCNKV